MEPNNGKKDSNLCKNKDIVRKTIDNLFCKFHLNTVSI